MRDHGDVSVRLRDILRAIAGIQETVGGLDLENYSTVWAVKHASERGIEIISEASRHIPERMKREEPAIPWRQIADVGNVLRHGYQTISDHVIWDVIVTHLDPLDTADGGCLGVSRAARIWRSKTNEVHPVLAQGPSRDGRLG